LQESIFRRLRRSVGSRRTLGGGSLIPKLPCWRARFVARFKSLMVLIPVFAEVNEQRMLWLEIIIVIFFALDLAIVVWVRR
jgi:hypothetical protein